MASFSFVPNTNGYTFLEGKYYFCNHICGHWWHEIKKKVSAKDNQKSDYFDDGRTVPTLDWLDCPQSYISQKYGRDPRLSGGNLEIQDLFIHNNIRPPLPQWATWETHSSRIMPHTKIIDHRVREYVEWDPNMELTPVNKMNDFFGIADRRHRLPRVEIDFEFWLQAQRQTHWYYSDGTIERVPFPPFLIEEFVSNLGMIC